MSILRDEDFEGQWGRAVGGDFMCITHKPTGISRGKGPPLGSPGKAREELMREVEAELQTRGWSWPSNHPKRRTSRQSQRAKARGSS